jgi:hypothetical protein
MWVKVTPRRSIQNYKGRTDPIIQSVFIRPSIAAANIRVSTWVSELRHPHNIILSSTSCKYICVTSAYNKRLTIRAISGCLYIYIYDIPHW